MTRGQVAKHLNINSETLRYYEKIGLIKPEYSNINNYRQYNEIMVSKLELIVRFKKLGFSLSEIKIFFNLVAKTTEDSKRFNKYLNKKINDIDNQIDGLISIKNSLKSFRDEEDKETCKVFSQFIEKT